MAVSHRGLPSITNLLESPRERDRDQRVDLRARHGEESQLVELLQEDGLPEWFVGPLDGAPAADPPYHELKRNRPIVCLLVLGQGPHSPALLEDDPEAPSR